MSHLPPTSPLVLVYIDHYPHWTMSLWIQDYEDDDLKHYLFLAHSREPLWKALSSWIASPHIAAFSTHPFPTPGAYRYSHDEQRGGWLVQQQDNRDDGCWSEPTPAEEKALLHAHFFAYAFLSQPYSIKYRGKHNLSFD